MAAALRWRLQGIGALDLTSSVRPEPVTAQRRWVRWTRRQGDPVQAGGE
jgi:hypothetical protein